jgi:hypothetical protein
MASRASFWLGPLAFILSLAWTVPSCAQSPQEPRPCSPPAENESDSTYRKVIIERIDFDGPIHVSGSDVDQIISDANRAEWHAARPEWIDQLTEIDLRRAWQDRGYFRVHVKAEVRSVDADLNHERFVVKAHVEEGQQYHVGEIKFVGESGIPEQEIRDVFPLREGELFNTSLLLQGIGDLTNLFGSRGYIDFTVVPKIEDDSHLQRIDLALNIDQQKQFRIGSVKIVGLVPLLETRLREITKQGQIIDTRALDEFFKDNRSILPAHWSVGDGFEERRDVKGGIVDLAFDFRPCGEPGEGVSDHAN